MNKKSIAGFVGLVAALAFASTAAAATFTTSLKLGSTGSEVKSLQMVLNSSADTMVAATGVGSAGMETTYFGGLTKAAVIKFQEKYASDILTPVGLTSGTGYVGPSTRAKLNNMGSTSSTSLVPGCTSTVGYSSTTGQKCDGAVTTTTPTGAGVMVSAPAQPANGLAIQGSSRVPFTKITLTAGSSDAVVNGITVERTGYSVNANFAGIVLLDEDGTQLDIAKTLGSTNQAIIGGTFTVKAGTSKTLTVAGNMNTGLMAYAGQVAGLTVVAVNATSVSGTLPITGAMHTINGTLTIGTAVASNSSYDPGSDQAKEIGTAGYKFTGLRLTAGSAEDVRLKSIRFYQAGSVGSGDLANVMIYVDATAYPTTVSSDGKYYTANFGSGIVISKGLAKDIYIAGDIVGSGAASRTIRFDLQKNTDLYVVGETYGQGIIATGAVNTGTGTVSGTHSTSLTLTPAVTGWAVTINAGSFTSVTKAGTVAAGNIAVNIPNQVLGGFEVDLKGEAISVQSQIFTIATTSGSGTGLLTNVSLYDQNGAVVAGPVDAVYASPTTQTVTFTDTVTYPIGKKVYTLKGKVASTIGGGTVYTTTATTWSSITGQVTGNTITSPALGFAMNSMTVKSAALAVAQSTTPAAQSIVAGGTNVIFANIQLDASASGEDVRLGSIALTDTVGGAAVVTNLTGCQLYDGTTALNTGSNVVNPSVAAATFTFDSQLTVAKNTVKTLALKCNVASGITGSFTWNMTGTQIGALSVSGVSSGVTVVATGSTTTGATQTIGTAALAVTTDSSSPAYTIATAGSTGVVLGAYKFSATNDAVTLNRIGLSLGAVTASSSASDLTTLRLFNGSVEIGTAEFVGTNRSATSTLAVPVVVPKDGSVVITVKADLANQSASLSSNPGALLTVNVDINGATGNKNTSGTNTSGSVVDPTGSTAVSGVRVFKSTVVVAKQNSGMSSTLIAQSGIDLYRFSVTASSKGDIALNKIVVNIATSSASTANGTTTVNNLKVYAYTDSAFSSPVGGSYTAGQVVATIAGLATGDNVAVFTSPLTISATATTYFKVMGDVAQVAGTTGSAGTVSTKIVGDASYYASANLMDAYTSAIGNFVWSPISTTSSASTSNNDWTNGYSVSGLAAAGTDSWTLTK